MPTARADWRSKVTKRLCLLRQLHSLAEGWLFVRIFCFAAATPLLMRVKLPRLAQMVALRFTRSSPDLSHVQQIIRLVELALQVGRPLICPRCLTRGLTLYYFLNRAGFDVALAFGASKPANSFVAHCWLLKDSEPFLETADPRTAFAILYVLPTATYQP